MSSEIERLCDVWNNAWLAKDAATVDALMTADYEYIGPNGKFWIERRYSGLFARLDTR